MTIETKFEVYDEIFFISNKKVCKSQVRGIKIEVTSCPQEISTSIIYLCNDDADARVHLKVDENDAFKTKQNLLESL